MRTEIDARGLTAEEIREALDSARNRKNKTTENILDDLEKAILTLISLHPECAERLLNTVKVHHPDMLKSK